MPLKVVTVVGRVRNMSLKLLDLVEDVKHKQYKTTMRVMYLEMGQLIIRHILIGTKPVASQEIQINIIHIYKIYQ